jgi:prepilin-type N-terminal cleavage/methylation domain-containing protein
MLPASSATPVKRPAVAQGVGARGFTLVEMMLALGIMLILAGLGGAKLVISFQHAKVRRAAAILTADLQYAQGMAAKQRRPVALILNPDLRFYVIRDRASAVVYRQRFLGDDTDYNVDVLTSDQQSSLVLFPTGVTPTTTTFTIGVQDYQRQVKITQAGQIRLLPLTP